MKIHLMCYGIMMEKELGNIMKYHNYLSTERVGVKSILCAEAEKYTLYSLLVRILETESS